MCLFILIASYKELNAQEKRITEPLSRYCKNLPTEISGIIRSSSGEIWIASNSGIYIFYGDKAEKIETLPSGFIFGSI